MNVKELKKILKLVPEHFEVVICKDVNRQKESIADDWDTGIFEGYQLCDKYLVDDDKPSFFLIPRE